jgi:hypothetical protein
MKFFKAFAEVLLDFPPDSLTKNIIQVLIQIHSRVIPQLAD